MLLLWLILYKQHVSMLCMEAPLPAKTPVMLEVGRDEAWRLAAVSHAYLSSMPLASNPERTAYVKTPLQKWSVYSKYFDF